MKPTNFCASSLLAIAAAALISGCASEGVKNPNGASVTQMNPDEQGFVAGTGIESQDIVQVTDKMSQKILNTPQISNAQGTPCIVLDPVRNETRFPINSQMFLTRIQSQLISKTSGKVSFLARDRMETLQHENQLKASGQVTANADPHIGEFKGADFFLTGDLQSLTTRTGAGTSDYIQYVFQLIDARTSVVVWQDEVDIKKQGQSDASYR